MILTAAEIDSRGIVGSPTPEGKRATTYDATVGHILLDGLPIEAPTYTLPKRGMIWVVSQEEFALPDDVTGLATLKTRWTHSGLLALNVGIIDPGYSGPLSTAVVNFSNKDFVIRKGETFFRVMFQEHKATGNKAVTYSKSDYLQRSCDRSVRFSDTFLNISSLANEVVGQIFTSSLGLVIAVAGLILSFLAIFAPIAYTVYTDSAGDKAEVIHLKREVGELMTQQKQDHDALRQLQTTAETPVTPSAPIRSHGG